MHLLNQEGGVLGGGHAAEVVEPCGASKETLAAPASWTPARKEAGFVGYNVHVRLQTSFPRDGAGAFGLE
jgi:hypothetical protein